MKQSKKTNPDGIISNPLSVPMDGRVIYDYQIQSLEGKLLTLIESLGLAEKQESALKDVFKDTFYRVVYFETTYVGGEYLQKAIIGWSETNGVGQRVGHN